MASIDMCEHDWPGSGCKECFPHLRLKRLTDEELVQAWHKQAREMSFYNAAEGESWYRERSMRESCSAEFKNINAELKRRELPTPKGNYLC